jgi:SAM-dependent methyltransferase
VGVVPGPLRRDDRYNRLTHMDDDDEIEAYLRSKYAGLFKVMRPPTSMSDATAWDTYWQNQLSLPMPPMVHMFVDDGALVDAMRDNQLRTVLCVGNGISLEPKALARAGFDVTALDLSAAAAAIAEQAAPPDEFLVKLIGGRELMSGGSLRFVTGDLLDPDICPGPYDVIIERKTLQLFAPEVARAAVAAVTARLGRRGIFFSHSHRNLSRDAGRSPQVDWVDEHGWPRHRRGVPVEGPTVWFFSTSG